MHVVDKLKAVVAAVGALIMVITAATADQAISLDEARGIWLAVEGILTAIGVYAVRNR